MKHLKRFNEDITSLSFEEDLKDFCETNLAYLTDNDVRVLVGKVDSIVRIVFDKTKTWNEVKDQIIPFLIRLNNKYEIEKFFSKKEIKVFLDYDMDGLGEDFYSIKDLINDKTKLDGETLLGFLFHVDGYKQPKKSLMTKIKSFFK